MSYFGRNFASSPVMALSPQSAHQVPFDRPVAVLQRHFYSFRQSASRNSQLSRTSSVAGRKRSRDEAAVNLDPPEKTVEPPVVSISDDDEDDNDDDEWVLGPGMILVKRSTGEDNDAVTRHEELAAQERERKVTAAMAEQERLSQTHPSLRGNKSQRIELSRTPSTQAAGVPSYQASPSPITPDTMSAPSGPAEPVVDDFTMQLGIGWNRISDSEHIQAAARGWARYIDNHYPVTDAKIRLESRGLQSYLVEAKEGFFLFAENLRHGRLVSRDAGRALQNLKSSPVVFDSPETMSAAESPQPQEDLNNNAYLTNAFATAVKTPVSVEVDMS